MKVLRLSGLFDIYRTSLTLGAKEKITLKMENVHLRHLLRILGDRPITEVTSGFVQLFVDKRSRETFKDHPVKPKTVRKAVSTLRFVMNWSVRQGHTTTKFPEVELTFPKERQAEPFRTYDQIAAIIARGDLDVRRIRELWDGLFLDRPKWPKSWRSLSTNRGHPGSIRSLSQPLIPVRGGSYRCEAERTVPVPDGGFRFREQAGPVARTEAEPFERNRN